MFSSCPFCHISVPINEIEWHVNNHIVEDELERDMELAQQIALAPASPIRLNESVNHVEASTVFPGKIPEVSTSSFGYSSSDYNHLHQEKIAYLVDLQVKSPFYKIEGGLMALLRGCLASEQENSRSIISGSIDHYQSIESEDSGWGCGWRNIQMLSSHLLMKRPEVKDVMFGGSGFVPDIPSLQRWLEIAWESGFDTPGAESFNYKIYGSKKWIGTTECAALFLSFGLRARIVDFDSISSSSRGKRIIKQVYGPMDMFLLHRTDNDFQEGPSNALFQQRHHDLATLSANSSSMINRDSYNKYKGKMNGHQVLVDWVWNYFTCGLCGISDSLQPVLISEKTPLYFQHDGHSRTIIGIQVQKGKGGSQDRNSLLVLDPGHLMKDLIPTGDGLQLPTSRGRTEALERSLRGNSGWQKLVKRGVHTLKKPQYQLCYVDPGIAQGEEFEQLKTVDSILVKF